MADDNKPQHGGTATLTDLAHVITSPISKFSESVTLIVNNVLSGKNVLELLTLGAGTAIFASMVIGKFREALRNDPDGWAEMEKMLRREDFIENLELSVKNAIEWHQKRTEDDRKRAKKPMNAALTNMREAGFPGVAKLFVNLGGVAGIEGLE